ncbi:MAG: sodium:solute symporter family protein [Eubacteriales bacterium]
MPVKIEIIIAVIFYLVIIAFLGYLGYRKTKNAEDYMVGGRQTHPFIMALSYGATFISTSAIIGFGGAAATFGLGLLWLTFLNIFVGIFIAFIFFGKRTRQMALNLKTHTFPELLSRRYNSPFIQKYSGTIIFLFMPLYAAAVMMGAANFLKTFFAIDYTLALMFFAVIVALYVSMGGIKGVLYTDAFQGTLMTVGMIILLVFTYSQLGGVTAAHEKLADLMNNPSIQEATAGMAKGGFMGWTAMPVFGSPLWFSLVSTIVMGVGIGVLAQPQLAVRFMMVKSNRELNRAVPIGGVFILLMTGVAFIVGSLSNIFFFESGGQIATVAAGGGDNVIPTFITQFMPGWFGIIFLIAMLSAAMSTLSSQAHAMGTSLSRDMIKQETDNKVIWLPKVSIIASVVIITLAAYYLPKLNVPLIIAAGTALFFGLCAAAFLPMYIGALYFKKLSKTAAIAGMMTGSISSVLWMLFIHNAESSKLMICKLLFGVDSLAAGSIVSSVDPIFIALPLSAVVTVIIALLTKNKTDSKYIEKVFENI